MDIQNPSVESPAKQVYQEIMDFVHLEEQAHPGQLVDVFLIQVPNFDIRQIGRYNDQLLFFRGFSLPSGQSQTVLVHYTQACIVLRPHVESSGNVPPRKKPIGFVANPEADE